MLFISKYILLDISKYIKLPVVSCDKLMSLGIPWITCKLMIMMVLNYLFSKGTRIWNIYLFSPKNHFLFSSLFFFLVFHYFFYLFLYIFYFSSLSISTFNLKNLKCLDFEEHLSIVIFLYLIIVWLFWQSICFIHSFCSYQLLHTEYKKIAAKNDIDTDSILYLKTLVTNLIHTMSSWTEREKS